MSTENENPRGSDRARSTRRVGRLRAVLVGGAALTSLATAGAIVADTGTDATASSASTTTSSTDASTSASGSTSSTQSSLTSTGGGATHATSSGS
ncbi:MAG: hypothetical protein ABIR34_04435 [Marmoricola sp.]